MHRVVLIALFLLGSAHEAAGQASAVLDTSRIEALTGLKGKFDAKAGVFKVSSPRTDLTVTVGGVRLVPQLGLTSWAAFERAHAQTIVMGDLVLTEEQVNPVMSVALENGLEVTALHNHFLGESPRIMFMHIGGMGDESALATAVGKVFLRLRASDTTSMPSATIDPATSTLDPKKIDSILGHPGELAGGVYKVTVGRTTRMHGAVVGAAMGVNTWAAFAGSDDQAVVDGDFAMLETELPGVLKALRRAQINIVAIHQHMTGEEPRIVFLHYWGIGSTEQLATGLASALAATGVSPSHSTR